MSVSMSKRGVILLALLNTTNVLAGQITVKGSSKLGHKVEYIALTVQVDSQCYPTQAEVLKATNGAASSIKEAMVSFMDQNATSRDQVIAMPGFASRSTLRSYDGATNRHEVVCTNAWHASNTLVLKIANYDAWPDLQQAILNVADSVQASTATKATTSITLQAPTPHLYDDTIKRLQAEAQRQALAKASTQFKEVAKQCGLTNHRIVTLNADLPPVMARARMAAENSRDDGVPPFEPEYDQIFVEAHWTITWDFLDNGSGCAAALSTLQ